MTRLCASDGLLICLLLFSFSSYNIEFNKLKLFHFGFCFSHVFLSFVKSMLALVIAYALNYRNLINFCLFIFLEGENWMRLTARQTGWTTKKKLPSPSRTAKKSNFWMWWDRIWHVIYVGWGSSNNRKRDICIWKWNSLIVGSSFIMQA